MKKDKCAAVRSRAGRWGRQECGADRSEDEKRSDKSLTGCRSGFKRWEQENFQILLES